MRRFTRKEVAKYNGKNGNPVYVIYNETVYDVSASFLWKDGAHQVLHSAGVDLTDALKQAPHGGDVFDKFPVVGIIQDTNESNTSSKR